MLLNEILSVRNKQSSYNLLVKEAPGVPRAIQAIAVVVSNIQDLDVKILLLGAPYASQL